jgi:hypothetical protein
MRRNPFRWRKLTPAQLALMKCLAAVDSATP